MATTVTVSRAAGESCACGCFECDAGLAFKQISAFKGRSVGFEPLLEEGEGSEYLYLGATYNESCARPCGYQKLSSYYCSALGKCDYGCEDDCCDFEPTETVLVYDQFRGCYKVQSGDCAILGPQQSCTTDTSTPTQFQGHCDEPSGPSSCCDSWTSSVQLSSPYDATQLAADIAAMRASVAWTDFLAWNCGGDVVGLETGVFIFPHETQTYFDAHYYTDDDESYIDKSWVLIRNNSSEEITIEQTFTPSDPEGAVVITELVLDPESEVEIAPPTAPGTITFSKGPCSVCYVDLSTLCRTRTASKTASEVHTANGCYYCGFTNNASGRRDAYTTASLTKGGTGNFTTTTRGGGNYTTLSGTEVLGEENVFTWNDCSVTRAISGSTSGTSTWESSYGFSASGTWEMQPSSPSNYSSWPYTERSVSGSEAGEDFSANCVSGTGDTEYCYLVAWVLILQGRAPTSPDAVRRCDYYDPDPANWTTTITVFVSESVIEWTETQVMDRVDDNRTWAINGALTLSDKIGVPESETIDDYGEEEGCLDLCSSYYAYTPTASSSELFNRVDRTVKSRIDQVTCPDPELYESITIKVVRFKIATPAECETAITHERLIDTIELVRTGAAGSYEWPAITDIEDELIARTELAGENGSLCLAYPTAIVTAAVLAE